MAMVLGLKSNHITSMAVEYLLLSTHVININSVNWLVVCCFVENYTKLHRHCEQSLAHTSDDYYHDDSKSEAFVAVG